MAIDRRGRTYARDAVGGVTTVVAGTLPIHAEGSPGSGVFDQPIDLRLVRSTANGNDLFGITDNAFTFATGALNGRVGDGWVSWGGRRGANRIVSRLESIGYLHWPTRAFRDLGGAPTYNRANLTAQRDRTHIIGGETFSRSATVRWNDLWPAIPQGRIDLLLGIDGTGVKEHIVVTQPAREWIAANRPPLTPASETLFGVEWQLDWSDIPRILVEGVQRGSNEDFDDTQASGLIELRDALDRRLAFIPRGRCWVTPRRKALGLPPEAWERPAVKRFWVDGGTPRMFVGLRVSHLAAMAAGDLIIDPPQTVDAATGTDCGMGETSPANFIGTPSGNLIYLWTGAPRQCAAYRFDMTAMSAEAVTASSVARDWGNDPNNAANTYNWHWRARDVAACAALSSTNSGLSWDDATNGTTATVAQTQVNNPTSGGAFTSASLNSIIQELVDSYGDTITTLGLAEIEDEANASFWLSIWDDAQAGEADPTLSVTQSAGSSATATPGNASLSFQGLAATIYTQTVAVPTNASLSFAGLAPVVQTQQLVTPANASLSFQGLMPVLYTELLVTPGNASLSFQGLAPLIIADAAVVSPANASLSYQGLAPTLALQLTIEPANASLSFIGYAPTIDTDQVTIRGHVGTGRRWRGRTYGLSYSDEVVVIPSVGRADTQLPPPPAAPRVGLGGNVSHAQPTHTPAYADREAVEAQVQRTAAFVAARAREEIEQLIRQRRRKRQQLALALLLS